MTADGVDPDDLAATLRVLAALEDLPEDHPDVVAVRRASGRLFKQIRKQRRAPEGLPTLPLVTRTASRAGGADQ